MLKRIRPSIGSAHVIALLALFAALGGGYAVAFSGSGTLQKAGADGLPTSFTDVRSLTGFGKIQARCDTGSGTVELQFLNSTSRNVQVFGESNLDQLEDLNVSPGELGETIDVASPSGKELFDLHMFRLGTDNKAQIDLRVFGKGVGPGPNCEATQLRILALNTQQ